VKTTRIGILLLVITLTAPAHLHAAQVLFTPELTLGASYSDNIFLAPDNEVDDFITTAGLGFTGEILGRTAGLALTYKPSYNSFADNSDLNFWRHAARLSIWSDFWRATRLSLSNDFLETENPRDRSIVFAPDDPLEGPAIEEDLTRRGRRRYMRNVAQARLDHGYGAQNRFFTEVRYSILEDKDKLPGIAVADHKTLRTSLGMEHWLSRRWGFDANVYSSNRDYEERDDRREYGGGLGLFRAFTRHLSGFVAYRHTVLYYDEETINDYQVYFPSAGIRYQLEENAYISIGVGYFYQEFRNRDENEWGFVVPATVFKRWPFRTGRIEFTGSSGSAIDDIGAEDRGFNIYYQGRLDLAYYLTRWVTATAYGAYRYDDYPNATIDTYRHTINAGAGLRYQALRWMNIALLYDFRKRAADREIDEYTENRATLLFTIAPATPFRLN
jgi:hypothetical protein